MATSRYRKHPRVYSKKQLENHRREESSISLSAMMALGILVVVFLKGLFWGYILKKSID